MLKPYTPGPKDKPQPIQKPITFEALKLEGRKARKKK